MSLQEQGIQTELSVSTVSHRSRMADLCLSATMHATDIEVFYIVGRNIAILRCNNH